MRSVVSKTLLVSMIGLSFVLSACGKKSTDSENAAISGTSSSISTSTSWAQNASLSSVSSAPCSGYSSYVPMQLLWNCGSPSFYLLTSGFMSQATASLRQYDVVSFSAGSTKMQYLMYKQNGEQVGPVDMTKDQAYSIVLDQNAVLYFGRTDDGSFKVNGLTVRRCLDGSNNQVSCP